MKMASFRRSRCLVLISEFLKMLNLVVEFEQPAFISISVAISMGVLKIMKLIE